MRPHTNLLAWKESISFAGDIYSLTRKFPDAEKYGITSQLRRAGVSISANVAEGAARNTKKEFVRFLYISSGSLSEVETLLIIAMNLEYMSRNDFQIFQKKTNQISSLLQGLIRKLKADL